MVISQKTFGGLMPRLDPTLLDDSAATVAHNCRLRSGKLTPMKKSASFMDYIVRLEGGFTDMKDALTLYLWKRGTRKEFLAWGTHVTVAPSNIFDDNRYRIFVAGLTGITGVEVTTPDAPVMNPDTFDPAGDQTYGFVQTFTDALGRESSCSPVSNLVTYKDNADPVLHTHAAAIAAGDVPADAVRRTIYRVLGIYGSRLYVKTASNGDWSKPLVAGAFEDITITLNSSLEGDKQEKYFANHYANQPCAYVSAIDSGGFDRHSICLDPLPKCTVVRAASPSPNAALDPANSRYTTFFQTWVDEYGYESPCSEGSIEVVYNDGDYMTVPVMSVIPEGAVKRRIYKVVTGTETESIQFIWEQDAVSDQFPTVNFKVKDEDAGEVLVNMTQCPKDLRWIVNMPGNFYAGFAASNKRQICFSEVNIPTSWPDAYKYEIREDVVGLAVSGTTLFALTVGQPYAISGTDPKAMTVSRIASNQACVSKYSICTMNNAIFYASQDGVCMLSEGNQAETVLTKTIFTKPQWTELNPASCLMAAHDAALHMFFQKADDTRVAYMLDMIDGSPVLTTYDEPATAVFADVESDGLYMIKGVAS